MSGKSRNKKQQRLARERMEQTGESYTAALAAVREEHEPRLRKPEAERIREGLSGGADGGYRTRPLYDLEQD